MTSPRQNAERRPTAGRHRFGEAGVGGDTVVMPLAEILRREPSGALPQAPRPENPRNQVIVFFSCKGGCGATMLSVNVSHRYARSRKSTCLVDMDLQLGDCLAALALQPKLSMAQALRNVQKGAGCSTEMFSRHDSGVSVLSQVGSLDDLDSVSAEALPGLVAELKRLFDVVVVDGVRDFSDNVLAVLDVADKIAIVTVQEVLAIRRARWAFNILRKIGYDAKDLTVVVNRHETMSEIPLKTISKIFAPAEVIPVESDASLVLQSLNRGVPLQALKAAHSLNRNVERVAGSLLGGPSVADDLEEPVEESSFWSRLMFWRRT